MRPIVQLLVKMTILSFLNFVSIMDAYATCVEHLSDPSTSNGLQEDVAKKLFKAWMFGNVAFPQIHQGVNIAIASVFLAEGVSAENIQSYVGDAVTAYKVMINAHKAHNVDSMPSASSIAFLLNDFFHITVANIQRAAKILDYPDYSTFGRQLLNSTNQELVNAIQFDPKFTLLKSKLLQYAQTAYSVLAADLTKYSKTYLAAMKKTTSTEGRIRLAQETRRTLILRVAHELEIQYPELRSQSIRYANLWADEPRSKAFFLAIAFGGTHGINGSFNIEFKSDDMEIYEKFKH